MNPASTLNCQQRLGEAAPPFHPQPSSPQKEFGNNSSLRRRRQLGGSLNPCDTQNSAWHTLNAQSILALVTNDGISGVRWDSWVAASFPKPEPPAPSPDGLSSQAGRTICFTQSDRGTAPHRMRKTPPLGKGAGGAREDVFRLGLLLRKEGKGGSVTSLVWQNLKERRKSLCKAPHATAGWHFRPVHGEQSS